MEYIYDIVLNFQDEYYDFYEWHSEDKIINVKKIPIYKITSKDYLNIKYNITTIERDNIPKKNKSFLLTNGAEVMAVLVDNNGKVIKKSSLIFEEADDILEDINHIKEINIKYKINKKKTITYISRRNKERLKYLKKYFKNIDKEKDEYFLKYLYYDIYHEEEEDINKIYDKLILLSEKDINNMYNYLKKINLELKR